MIICAGDKESFDFALPLGIGLINMSINLTKYCMLNPPQRLLFVGTAGSYGSCKIGEIYESSCASNVEIGYFKGLSYTPLDNILVDENSIVSRETSEDKIVNSSNYITKNSLTCKEFLNAKLELENMEFFAVLHVAKSFNIPVRGVFYVTNYCDENAHEDFLKNHSLALQKLSLHVNKFYKSMLK